MKAALLLLSACLVAPPTPVALPTLPAPETVTLAPLPVPTHRPRPTPAPTHRPRPTPTPRAARERPVYAERLSVTAYCTGSIMANGQAPYVGAAAGNRWHFGTVLLVPGRGEVVVKDRIGYGSDLDLYMSSCAEAEAWGRRSLLVTQYHS